MEHATRRLLTAAAVGALAALANYAVGRRIEARHPPTGKFVVLDGVRLHYIERGGGPPVVLLHGNGAMAAELVSSGLVDALAAAGHRVIAFDRPGFGHSTRPRGRVWTPQAQADLLVAAWRMLGIERPVVVGHSWGCLVAMAMAQRLPAEVAGLVLASGYYYPSARKDVWLLSGPAVPVVGDVMRYTVSPLAAWLAMPTIVRKLFEPAPVTPAFNARFPAAMTVRPWQIRAAAEESALMVPAAAMLEAGYRELEVPMVVIAGDGDQLVDTEAQSARLAREAGSLDFDLVEGAGHMVHHLAPERIVEAVDKLAPAWLPAATKGARKSPRPRPLR